MGHIAGLSFGCGKTWKNLVCAWCICPHNAASQRHHNDPAGDKGAVASAPALWPGQGRVLCETDSVLSLPPSNRRSRLATSLARSAPISCPRSWPCHLRTCPAQSAVCTFERSINETTAPATWFSGATFSAFASSRMMSASIPGRNEPVLAPDAVPWRH